MILEITKIPGGLRWDNVSRLFTYNQFNSGYDIQGSDIALIELDNEIFILCNRDSTIDGQTFSNIVEELNYIYEI